MNRKSAYPTAPNIALIWIGGLHLNPNLLANWPTASVTCTPPYHTHTYTLSAAMPKHTRSSSANPARYAQPSMPVSVASSGPMPIYRPSLQLETEYYSQMAAEAPLTGTTAYDQYTPNAPAPAPSAAHQSAPRRVSSGAWSEEQDILLIHLRKTAGNWAKIAEHFSNKTGNACRKRHERLMERQNTPGRNGDTLQRVSKAYMGMRKEVWRELAKQTGLKWSDVEHIVSTQSPFRSLKS